MNTIPSLHALLEQKKWVIRLLLLASIAAGTMASDMYVPSLPAIAEKLQVSTIAVKWTLSIYLLGFASLQLVYGPLSDRFGRKPILLWGFVISFLGSSLCAIAMNINVLLLGRFIQGMGIGAGATLGRSIVQDLYHNDEEKLSTAISSMMVVFSIAPIIAPVFGGYLQQYWGWHSVFIVFCVYLSIIGTLVFFLFPETHLAKNPHALHLCKLWTLYKKMLSTPSFLIFTLLSGVSFGGILAYYAISPFLYQAQLGLSAVQYGWLALATAVVLLISRGLNIVLAKRWAIPTRLKIGLCCLWLGPFIMTLLALFHQFNIAVILFPYMIFMLGSGLVMPNAMISAVSEFNHAKGSAAGLYSLCQLTVVFIISVTASHLREQTQIGLALLLLITTGLAQGLYLVCRRYLGG
ncbi:MAG: putative multidrug resistance protein [Gammaproteobacteria bacterium]|jgi:Bcr/CflA subfamily drug resistance transporter|nr:putative multidrug resistance protein [Gammaproteobacteria bacterium]